MKLAGGINAYQYVPNPTGWVDPLGLSNCPGGNGCSPKVLRDDQKKTYKSNANEPTLPNRQLASEALAKEKVTRLERQYRMHTIGKHGPDISDSALKQRAIDGTNPITGRKPRNGKGEPSSKFSIWTLQLTAIERALSRESDGLPKFTGKDQKDNYIV